jgi:outer membrane protein
MAKQNISVDEGSFLKKGLLLVSFVFSIAALVVGLMALLKEDRIVYVDSMKLITNYKGAKVAKEAYDKKVAVWKANIDTLTLEMNRVAIKYEREKGSMTAREKKLSEELLAAKQGQLENYRQATAENASKEDQQVTGKIFSEINDFLKQYGEKNGYEYIMAATNVGNIVFAKKGNDITDEVLEKMNAEYQSTHK